MRSGKRESERETFHDKVYRVMAATSLALFALLSCSLVAISNGCTGKRDCSLSDHVCCNNECVYGSSCIGRYCTFNFDCSSHESCCNNKCKSGSDCIAFSCSIDSDCGNRETCCFGKCQHSYEDCYDSTVVIMGSIFGSLLLIFLISMCIIVVRRRRRRIHRGRVIVGRRITPTITTTRCATQSNPSYRGQVPPSYQQIYPYYPPPQYGQPQTINPPPYNPGTVEASEQPPPYTAESQGGSRGVIAPKRSYGTIPSAPHL